MKPLKTSSRSPAPEAPFAPRFSCIAGVTVSPGLRVDRYVSETLKILSRSQIKARNLRVRVNGKEVKISRLLKGGEELDFFWNDPEPTDLVPEDIPLDVVYEDSRVAVINKAPGMVVHPGAGNSRGTLANALYFRRLQKFGGGLFGDRPLRDRDPSVRGLRPGIVHRLGKDTSGLIITAWDEEAHIFLAEQFKNRRVTKTYAALVHGCPRNPKGRIEVPICRNRRDRKLFAPDPKGKPSLTSFQVVKTWGRYSLLLLRPKTGRTHQIRVHLKYLGNPIFGDPLYGAPDSFFPQAGLMLHAKRLSLVLPGIKTRRTFRTSLPPRFLDVIAAIGSRPRV